MEIQKSNTCLEHLNLNQTPHIWQIKTNQLTKVISSKDSATADTLLTGFRFDTANMIHAHGQ